MALPAVKKKPPARGARGAELDTDDNEFEVGDAKCNDGHKYDLTFDSSFKLIKKWRIRLLPMPMAMGCPLKTDPSMDVFRIQRSCGRA